MEWLEFHYWLFPEIFSKESLFAALAMLIASVFLTPLVPGWIRETVLPLLIFACTAYAVFFVHQHFSSRYGWDWPVSVYVTAILAIAFGLLCCLQSIRVGDRFFRHYGIVFSYILFSLWAFWFGYLLNPSAWVVIIPTMLAASALWTPIVVRCNKRAIIAHQQRQGLCEKCEYDLRGSVGSTTCPECGHPIQNAP